MEEDAGNYLYNLVGIVVHSGGAEGGHYISYIRDRGKNAYQGGDGKSQVDGASGGGSNSNVSGAGFMEGLERGVSAEASSMIFKGVEEAKVEGVVGEEGRHSISLLPVFYGTLHREKWGRDEGSCLGEGSRGKQRGGEEEEVCFPSNVCCGRRTFHTCVVVGLMFKSYACRRRRRSRDARVAVRQTRSTLAEASPIQTASLARFFGRTLA